MLSIFVPTLASNIQLVNRSKFFFILKEIALSAFLLGFVKMLRFSKYISGAIITEAMGAHNENTVMNI